MLKKDAHQMGSSKKLSDMGNSDSGMAIPSSSVTENLTFSATDLISR